MHRPTVLVSLLATGLTLALAGCSKPTHDDPIRAANDESFQAWIDTHQAVLSSTEVKELNDARQMLRYRTMESRRGLSSAEQAREVYAQIDGKRLNELLALSYALQIERVRVELENYKPLVEKYQAYKANQNLTDASRREVDAKLANLERLTREHQEEIGRLTQRLNELRQSEPPKSS